MLGQLLDFISSVHKFALIAVNVRDGGHAAGCAGVAGVVGGETGESAKAANVDEIGTQGAVENWERVLLGVVC